MSDSGRQIGDTSRRVVLATADVTLAKGDGVAVPFPGVGGPAIEERPRALVLKTQAVAAADAIEPATPADSIDPNDVVSISDLLGQRNELIRLSRELLYSLDNEAEMGDAADALWALCRRIVPEEPVIEDLDENPHPTQVHIDRVRELLCIVRSELKSRGLVHDRSKLESPEREIFEEMTPKLRGLTYGSAEYQACLQAMQPALEHHYANNAHHPEHYGFKQCKACGTIGKRDDLEPCKKEGCGSNDFERHSRISGMSLLDLVEMFCDWKAAGERHADGSLQKSIQVNRKRFNIPPELVEIFENTRVELGW